MVNRVVILTCAGALLAVASLAAQGRDTPEAALRALMLARYSNDVAAFERVTLPHPERTSLMAGGRADDALREELLADPDGLQMREMRPMLFRGEPVEPDANGQFPLGATALYMIAHRGGPMVVSLVRQADGWKVDLRWWVAAVNLASGRTSDANAPDEVIRSLLGAMLRLDRSRAAQLITAERDGVDLLFMGAPSQREPSGVLDEAAASMPIVELGPGEFITKYDGEVVEATTSSDRKVLVGLFGPVEMPFIVRRAGTAWRVEPQPYFALMEQ